MKTKIIIIYLVAIILAAMPYIILKKYMKENKILNNNQETLLTENKKFKVNDSLNAMKVSMLQLSIKELNAYRYEDAKLIDNLKISNSELKQVISINTETIKKLKLNLNDSIIKDTITNIIDTLKCFSYSDKWIDISGCIDNDTIQIVNKNRESLKAIESLKRKKFWFIKLPIWLFGYKNKEITIVSNNPSTTVTEIEFISIKE